MQRQESYKRMLNRDGTQTGEILNMRSRKCQMEGCPGWRIHVKWPNGRHTYPCEKGVNIIDAETMQIV